MISDSILNSSAYGRARTLLTANLFNVSRLSYSVGTSLSAILCTSAPALTAFALTHISSRSPTILTTSLITFEIPAVATGLYGWTKRRATRKRSKKGPQLYSAVAVEYAELAVSHPRQKLNVLQAFASAFLFNGTRNNGPVWILQSATNLAHAVWILAEAKSEYHLPHARKRASLRLKLFKSDYRHKTLATQRIARQILKKDHSFPLSSELKSNRALSSGQSKVRSYMRLNA